MILRTFILLGAVLLSSCRNMPEPFAPPVQRQPFDHFKPYRLTRIIDMADADADLHVVRDVIPSAGSWRWTRKHPEVRLLMRTNEKLSYVMDFTVVEETLKQTGPVTVSFFVNDHLVDQMKCNTSGSRHFEKPIPPEWVEPGKDALVGAEVDKMYVSPADHEELGLIISRIGLTQE